MHRNILNPGKCVYLYQHGAQILLCHFHTVETKKNVCLRPVTFQKCFKELSEDRIVVTTTGTVLECYGHLFYVAYTKAPY